MKKRKRKNFDIKFYEKLLEKKPNFVNVLISLGDEYTSRGFYEKGLAIDRKLAQLCPFDEVVRYNLACSLSLLGEVEESLKQFKKAVLLGYSEFAYILEDSDLINLRASEGFKNFYHKIIKTNFKEPALTIDKTE